MTVFNIATEVSAVITTDAANPPKFELDNFQELADAINANPTTPSYTRGANTVVVPIYSSSTAPIQLAPNRPGRKSILIHNPNPTNHLRVVFENSAGSSKYILVSPMGSLTLNDSTFSWTSALYGISHGTSGFVVFVGEVY